MRTEEDVFLKNHVVKGAKLQFISNIANFIRSPFDFFAQLRISKPMCVDHVASAALHYSLYGTSPIKVYDKRNLLATILIVLAGSTNRLALFKRRFKNQKNRGNTNINAYTQKSIRLMRRYNKRKHRTFFTKTLAK